MEALRAPPHLTSTRCARTCVIWPRKQTLTEAPFRWRTERSSVLIARRTKAGAAWTAWHIPRTGSPGNRPWPTAVRGMPQMGSKRGHDLAGPLLLRSAERFNLRIFADARDREL